MENLTTEQLKKIIAVYEKLERNVIIDAEVQEAYNLLPNTPIIDSPRSRLMLLRRFVIMNYQEIMDRITAPMVVEKLIENINGDDREVYKLTDKPQNKRGRKPKAK